MNRFTNLESKLGDAIGTTTTIFRIGGAILTGLLITPIVVPYKLKIANEIGTLAQTSLEPVSFKKTKDLKRELRNKGNKNYSISDIIDTLLILEKNGYIESFRDETKSKAGIKNFFLKYNVISNNSKIEPLYVFDTYFNVKYRLSPQRFNGSNTEKNDLYAISFGDLVTS